MTTTHQVAYVRGGVERHQLDAASWVDIGRGWLQRPDEIYAALAEALPWRQAAIWTYDHARPEPRLSASCRPGTEAPHPAVTEIHKALRRLYRVDFMPVVGLSWYRDGRDAMGAHRDSDLRHCEETVIAIVTLGATRPWTLAPKHDRTATTDLAPAAGDLIVMGGRAQLDWLHGVPPAPGVRSGRMSLQWRWTSGRGRPEVGGSSRAPRRYGGGR